MTEDLVLFDTHSHLNDPDLMPHVDAILERARSAGVRRIVVPGYDRASSLAAITLAERFPQVYAAVGFHPNDAKAVTEQDFALLKSWCAYEKVVAIGEIGLDYHYDTTDPLVQQTVFRRQIELAREADLPIVVHDREAHADILRILSETQAQAVGGIMHCFSGSAEMAAACVHLNFYISLAGPLTFKNAKKPIEAARSVRKDRLLIETDAPWLTPEPFRGKKNEPAYVRHVAEKLALILEMDTETAAQLTYQNALRAFRLPE